MTTTERLWIAYCAAVVAVAIAAADGGEPEVRRVPFVLVHVAMALLQVLPVRLARRSESSARVARALLATIGLPVVFSSLCWLLPGVHPTACHLAFYRLDLALFGQDLTAPLRASLPEWVLTILQCVYASFYAVPFAAVVLSGRARGARAFDEALTLVTGGFLLSYLGYLWFPTLGPKDVLPTPMALSSPLGEWLRVRIDAAEANPWDCFPSGHTMLSLVGVLVVRRRAPRAFVPMLVVALAIAFSTLALRYHWPVDVVSGAALAAAWVRYGERTLGLDGIGSRRASSGDLEALPVGRLDQRIVP